MVLFGKTPVKARGDGGGVPLVECSAKSTTFLDVAPKRGRQ